VRAPSFGKGWEDKFRGPSSVLITTLSLRETMRHPETCAVPPPLRGYETRGLIKPANPGLTSRATIVPPCGLRPFDILASVAELKTMTRCWFGKSIPSLSKLTNFVSTRP
jgi:hypothetical protein